MPSPRRHGRSRVDYIDDDGASSDDGYRSRKSSRPRGYDAPRDHLQRNNSLISLRKEENNAKEESDWDTDYDPRDRYYLSEEDDPLDLYSPSRKGSTREEPSKDRDASSRHRSTDHDSSSTRRDHSHSQSHTRSQRHSHSHSHSHSNSHSHPHSHSHTHSHSHSRDNEDDGSTSRHKTSSSSRNKAGTHSTTSRPRPKPARAGSSYLTGIHRPRAVRAGSSYTGSRSARPRISTSRSTSFGLRGSKPKSSTKTSPRPWQNFAWSDAAKVAMQAGTVAAIKVGSDSVPWSVKGTKIASAALGAAVVDHVLKPKKKGGVKYAAMRHLAEVAVGNLVVGPALGKAGGGGRNGGGRRSK